MSDVVKCQTLLSIERQVLSLLSGLVEYITWSLSLTCCIDELVAYFSVLSLKFANYDSFLGVYFLCPIPNLPLSLLDDIEPQNPDI